MDARIYVGSMYVTMLGGDGPLNVTTYHVTWLPPGNKALTYLFNTFYVN